MASSFAHPQARTSDVMMMMAPATLDPFCFGNDNNDQEEDGGGAQGPAISALHSLGPYGLLHATTLPDEAMLALRAACAITPCDHIHPDARAFLNPQTMAVVQQAAMGARAAAVKVPDGYFVIAPERGNQLLSIIKDAPMCLPAGMDHALAPPIAPNGARTLCFSVLPHPEQDERTTRVFRLVFHDGFTNLDEISRMAMADHAIAQITCHIPLRPDDEERPLMESGLIGRFVGQCLCGEQADLVKRAFLGLVAQTASNPSAVYNVPIELSSTLASILQFKTAVAGQLALGRLADGIVGYWRRSDGKNTFVFAASSDDFAAAEPAPVQRSALMLYRMSYLDDTGAGARVFVRVQADAACTSTKTGLNVLGAAGAVIAADCPYKLPLIMLGKSSMSDVMAIVATLFKHAGREEMDCSDFGAYCQSEAMGRLQEGQPMDDLSAAAAHAILSDRAPIAPASSFEDSSDLMKLLLSPSTPQREERGSGDGQRLMVPFGLTPPSSSR